ncbi:MAG: nucleotide exchange factor GrpE [Blastocatellia bacterium]|nr:MAG: nucleotide exchange factor GrpE [Blastocatellia bacterium]
MMRRERENRDERAEPVRVTDRRRISLDPDPTEQSLLEGESPSLKPTYVEELEARTKAAERQVQEVQARFDQLRQQLQRETDETRQRLNRAADERATADKARLIASLLPVVDNLNRAIDAATTNEATLDSLLQGVRGIASSFQKALTAAGVESLESVGQDFNPELHEAVDTEEVGPERDGKIISEYSRGFKLGDRLLRPARVRVGRASQARNANE